MSDWPPFAKPSISNPLDGAVGIVLPVRNDTRFFKLCFYSLLAFTDYRFMLTIVDAESTAKTWPTLENIRLKYKVNVLQYTKPHNLAAEWNLGARFMFSFATVKFGLVIRPTVVVEPFWLSAMIHALKREPQAQAALALPCTPRNGPQVLLFRREAYEAQGGFDEAALDPVAAFVERLEAAGGLTTLSKAFVHPFTFESFNPTRPEPTAAQGQAPEEATHARA